MLRKSFTQVFLAIFMLIIKYDYFSIIHSKAKQLELASLSMFYILACILQQQRTAVKLIVDLNGIQRIFLQIQINQLWKRMHCLNNQQDYLELKLEDNSDHYLFNSLLSLQRDYQNQGEQFNEVLSKRSNSDSLQSGTQIIEEIQNYLCLRTKPLGQILDHIDQYYTLNNANRKLIILSIKKRKHQLKRQHAKRKTINCQSEFEIKPFITEIKTEQSGISPAFDQESIETKKKKRNRMSAQNSRDRKKQYIKQIQRQNDLLRKRVAELEHRTITPTSRDFVKLLICLGITCFMNLNPGQLYTPSNVLSQQKQLNSPKAPGNTSTNQLPAASKVDLSYFKSLLPFSYQQSIKDISNWLEEPIRQISQMPNPSDCLLRTGMLQEQGYLMASNYQKYHQK